MKTWFSLIACALGFACVAAPAAAESVSAFEATLASNGVLPDINTDINDLGSVILNTDSGDIYQAAGYGAYSLITPVAGQSELVAQPGGPSVMVFNFSSFTVPTGDTVFIQGSRPVAISATGAITINGTVDASPNSNCLFSGGGGCTPRDRPGTVHGAQSSAITGGGGAGGTSPTSYAPGFSGSPTTTGGGGGGGGHGETPIPAGYGYCCNINLTGGAGGGGGSSSAGQAGQNGAFFPSLPNAPGGVGGNAFKSLTILQGGGGGGSGGSTDPEDPAGGQGGNGGGAIVFLTPGNMTIGNNGAISADGADGAGYGTAAGGGGGGGSLWFDVAGALTNDGYIGALGGEGGAGISSCYNGPCSFDFGGAGSGGLVRIDPQSFSNYGTIDVSDGNGGTTFGGDVVVGPTIFNNYGNILGVGPASAVPEPSTWALLLAGLAALGFEGYRRKTRLARINVGAHSPGARC